MACDLHTHSAFSDGTDEPAQLWAAAKRAGLTGVAVVDHDTTRGWAELAAVRPPGITMVRGAELSTHVLADGHRVSIHLLAYLFDPAYRPLADQLDRLRDDRWQRGMAMVDKLIGAGIPITRERVAQIAGQAPIGRPHLGRALVEAGLVPSVTAAFTKYLSARGPFYVAKADIGLIDAIGLVRGAGGVPVVAHPRSRGASAITSPGRLRQWADAGLAGIEVDHPDHAPADRVELRAIADRLGLIATGSSDYHGANKSIRIGQDTCGDEVMAAIAAESSGVVPLLGADE